MSFAWLLSTISIPDAVASFAILLGSSVFLLSEQAVNKTIASMLDI